MPTYSCLICALPIQDGERHVVCTIGDEHYHSQHDGISSRCPDHPNASMREVVGPLLPGPQPPATRPQPPIDDLSSQDRKSNVFLKALGGLLVVVAIIWVLQREGETPLNPPTPMPPTPAAEWTGLRGQIVFLAPDGSIATSSFKDINFGKLYGARYIFPVVVDNKEFELDPKDIKAVKVLTRITSTEAKKWPSRFESSEVVPKLKVEITSRNGEKKTYGVYATYWVTFLRNEGEKKETFNWWRVKEIAISQSRPLTENPPSESVASVVCTFSANTKGGVADGIVYSVGFGDRLKTRGTIDKKKATIHFIVNKQMVYIWNASYNQGAKFPFKVKSVNQIFIHNLAKGFNCKDWTPDNSLLEVPKNIKFKLTKGDVSALDWLLL